MKIPEKLKGKKVKHIVLDPVGYFLIGVRGVEIGVAFCHYKDQQGWYKNTIEENIYSTSKEEILKWVRDNKLFSRQDHYNYLVRELNRAEQCIKKGEKYVQD